MNRGRYIWNKKIFKVGTYFKDTVKRRLKALTIYCCDRI